MGITGLAHIGIPVFDVETSKRFYRDMLCMTVLHENELKDRNGSIKVCFMKNDNMVLELFQMPVPEAGRKDGHVDHIAFAVKDIDKVRADLARKGILFEQENVVSGALFENGSRWILFRGPDNELLELNEVL